MEMRTTQPNNNKYYIRKASGGYNGAVKGSPTIKGADVLCNCVGYANGRFGEIQNLGYIKYQLVCNAENFIEKAKSLGLEISPVPVLGGIMVWQKGSTLSGNDGAGHVAVVEKVISATQIITSESGWASFAFRTITRTNNDGRWGISNAYKFRGCIVNPAIGKKGAEEIKKVAVDGEWGIMTTLLSQKVMGTTQDGIVSGQRTSCKKYLPNADTSSWEFSINGKGSPLIKAIQKLVGVTIDGIAGQNTVKALQRFLRNQNLYASSIDGIMGTYTVRAWQKYINNPNNASKPTDSKPASSDKRDVKIGQATCNEKGKAVGGKAGDQTKKEVAICNWSYNSNPKAYNHWTQIFRAKDKKIAEKIAKSMREACANNHIGYDLGSHDRGTLYDEAKAVGWDIPKIKNNCETSCVDLVSVCLNSAGIKTPKYWASVNVYKDLMATGKFECFTSKEYTASSKKLEVGDILCSPNAPHSAMVVYV